MNDAVVWAGSFPQNPWDSRETLQRCGAPDWWVYVTPGYTVQPTDSSAAPVPTPLSEEVTSIHPIKPLAQARQRRRIGHTPPLLSRTGPLLKRETRCCSGRVNVRGAGSPHAGRIYATSHHESSKVLVNQQEAKGQQERTICGVRSAPSSGGCSYSRFGSRNC